MNTWRHHLLSGLNFEKTTDTDIYEFGVFTGESVKIFLENVPGDCFDKIWGFDSFEGLPFCDAEPLHQGEWCEGGFDSRKFTTTTTPDAASKRIEEIVSNEKYKPVVGFYDQTLTDDIVHKLGLKPACIIDIDVDIYSSAYTVLDFMFRNKLYKKGTFLLYDDWGGSIGWETLSSGESRAHRELTAKYNINAVQIYQAGNAHPHVQKAFVII
jgi:hypothetical protein